MEVSNFLEDKMDKKRIWQFLKTEFGQINIGKSEALEEVIADKKKHKSFLVKTALNFPLRLAFY